jgi:hypothetical protein
MLKKLFRFSFALLLIYLFFYYLNLYKKYFVYKTEKLIHPKPKIYKSYKQSPLSLKDKFIKDFLN